MFVVKCDTYNGINITGRKLSSSVQVQSTDMIEFDILSVSIFFNLKNDDNLYHHLFWHLKDVRRVSVLTFTRGQRFVTAYVGISSIVSLMCALKLYGKCISCVVYYSTVMVHLSIGIVGLHIYFLF
jgi:hypothetical protein